MNGGMLGGGGGGFKVPAQQADATLSQANPVSGTKYTVLATTKNVRVIGAAAAVTWSVQPSPLEIHFTIDGVAITHTVPNPVSGTNYYPYLNPDVGAGPTSQPMTTDREGNQRRAFTYEGRSVKVEVETTGGTSNPLQGRVIYAKW